MDGVKINACGRFWKDRGVETTKSGGLRVEWVPSESHFEPCSQRYGLFLVCGCRQPI